MHALEESSDDCWSDHKLPLAFSSTTTVVDEEEEEDVVPVELPVVKMLYDRAGDGSEQLISVTITAEMEKPIPEFSDKFWYEFCSRATIELQNQFFLPTAMMKCCFCFFFFLLSAAAIMTPFQFYTSTVLIFLTVPWIIHCRLCDLGGGVGDLYLVSLVTGSISSFCAMCYALGAILILLTFTMIFYMYTTVDEVVPTIANFLHTLNVHCQHELKGFTIECVNRKTCDVEHEEVLIFKTSSTVDQQAKHDDFHSSGLHIPDVNENQHLESRVFVNSLKAWKRILQKHQKLYDDDDNYSNDENANHDDDTTSTKDLSKANFTLPSGISSKAWRCFVEDISAEIESHDKASQAIIVILIIHALISVAFYELYGAINWLLPLHMTPPLFFNRFLRDKLKRKFYVIEALGGQSSLLGWQYEVSYHPVLWYSRSQDYILIKHRDDSDKELADEDVTLGESCSTTTETNESLLSA